MCPLWRPEGTTVRLPSGALQQLGTLLSTYLKITWPLFQNYFKVGYKKWYVGIGRHWKIMKNGLWLVKNYLALSKMEVVWQLTLSNAILNSGTIWPCISWQGPPFAPTKNPSTKIIPRAHSTLKNVQKAPFPRIWRLLEPCDPEASPSSPSFPHLVLVDQHVRRDITRRLVCQFATNRIPKRFLPLKPFATKIVLKIIYRSRHEVTHLESQYGHRGRGWKKCNLRDLISCKIGFATI